MEQHITQLADISRQLLPNNRPYAKEITHRFMKEKGSDPVKIFKDVTGKDYVPIQKDQTNSFLT